MSSIEALLARARSRGSASRIAAPPRLRTVILTCMDARIDPVGLFGLEAGDAHVLRNAGALATPDVLRSIALSQAILGTREVLVLGHTGCGLLDRTEQDLSSAIRLSSGHDAQMELGAFQDLDEAVDGTVAALRECRFLAHRDGIRGFVYELESGHVRPVGEPGKPRPTVKNRSGLDMLRADVLNLNRSARHR